MGFGKKVGLVFKSVHLSTLMVSESIHERGVDSLPLLALKDLSQITRVDHGREFKKEVRKVGNVLSALLSGAESGKDESALSVIV